MDARAGPLWAEHTRSQCDWQMLSYAVRKAALPLSRLVASRETSLLVHGKEVAEAD